MMELITTTMAAVKMDTLRSFTLGEIVYLETEHGCTLLFEGTIPYQKSSKRQKIQNIMWSGVPCSFITVATRRVSARLIGPVGVVWSICRGFSPHPRAKQGKGAGQWGIEETRQPHALPAKLNVV